MYNIKSLYTDYGEIIATFGEDKIESRITYFLDAINIMQDIMYEYWNARNQ